MQKRIKSINFNFEGAHLAVCSPDQGGACSLVNDPIALKSLNPDEALGLITKSLAAGEAEMLEEMGEPISSKSLNPTDEVNEGNDDMASEETKALQKEVAALTKALAVKDVQETLGKYELGLEINKELASALTGMGEGSEAVFKALDSLVSMGEYGVAVASVVAKEKAKLDVEGNPLGKSLDDEAGDDLEGDEPLEKSLVQRIQAHQEEGAK